MGIDGRRHPLRNLTRWVVLAAALAAVVLLVMGLYADFGALGAALAGFRWSWLPAALALTSANYLLRFLRWHWYLGRLRIQLPLARSVSIFLAGMSMAISPGKIGEALKCVLLLRSFDVPVGRSAPVVFAERLTDLFGVAILASLGAVAVGTTESWPLVVIAVAAGLALAALVRAPFFFRLVRLPDAGDAAARLLDLRSLAAMSALAAVSWFFECLAAYVCFRGLGLDVSIEEAVVAFTLASLAGALSFLPGGIGVTEASMTGLLQVLAGVGRVGATAGTVIVRLVTLWFGVAVGLVALAVEERISRRPVVQGAVP